MLPDGVNDMIPRYLSVCNAQTGNKNKSSSEIPYLFTDGMAVIPNSLKLPIVLVGINTSPLLKSMTEYERK